MAPTTSSSRPNTETRDVDFPIRPAHGQRSRVGRSVAKLALAGVALVALILILGDLRRKAAPLSQAAAYARQLTTRLGETSTLPLNLEFVIPDDVEQVVHKFEHLSHQEARVLRHLNIREAVIVAHTRVIRNVLMPNGRATVVFRDGRFEPVWMPLERFEKQWAAQHEILKASPP